MIIGKLRITVPSKKRDAALEILRLFTGPKSVQLGCVTCQLYLDIDDANTLTLIEELESWKSLYMYILSDEFRNLLVVMDMASEPPEILVSMVSCSKGWDLVEALHLPNG